MLNKKCDGQANQVTAYQVGRERAERQFRQRRIEPQAEAPAQPCAARRTDSYRKKSIKRHDELARKYIRILSQHPHRREAAARCAEIGGLALVEPRRNQLQLPVIDIAAHVKLERSRLCIIHAYAAFARRSQLLRDITALHDFTEHAARKVHAAIRALAAIAAVRL